MRIVVLAAALALLPLCAEAAPDVNPTPRDARACGDARVVKFMSTWWLDLNAGLANRKITMDRYNWIVAQEDKLEREFQMKGANQPLSANVELCQKLNVLRPR